MGRALPSQPPNLPSGSTYPDGSRPQLFIASSVLLSSSRKERTVPAFDVKPLDESTLLDFARLVEKHNGAWGGCWCMAFHSEGVGLNSSAAQNRCEKERRVRDNLGHAALVF